MMLAVYPVKLCIANAVLKTVEDDCCKYEKNKEENQ